LRYAADAAKGLADMHSINVVHADLTIKQYLVVEGRVSLADFNLGVFLKRNSTDPSRACTFKLPFHYGVVRAPEEYRNKGNITEPLTKAIDVFSLGSILYNLLTGNKVWSGMKKGRAQESVANGIRPRISSSIVNSTDPVDQILMRAIDMCYVYDPKERPTAREVADFLHRGWRIWRDRLDPEHEEGHYAYRDIA